MPSVLVAVPSCAHEIIEAADEGCDGLFYRQQNANSCSAPDLGFDANTAAMRLNDSSDDGQAKSGAFGFRRAQDRRERPALQFLAHALAGVLEFHRHMRRPFTCAR